MISARGGTFWAGLTLPTMIWHVCPWCSRQPAGTNAWRPAMLPTMIWHQSMSTSLGLEGRRHLQLSFNLFHKPLYQRTKLKTELPSKTSPQESAVIKTLAEAWESNRKWRGRKKVQFLQKIQCCWAGHARFENVHYSGSRLYLGLCSSKTAVAVATACQPQKRRCINSQIRCWKNAWSVMVSHLSQSGLMLW